MKKILTLGLITLGTLVSCGNNPVSKEEFFEKVEKELNQWRQMPDYTAIYLSGFIKYNDSEIKSTDKSVFKVDFDNEHVSLINDDPFADKVYHSVFVQRFMFFGFSELYTITNPTYADNATYYIYGYKQTKVLKGFDTPDADDDVELTLEMDWNNQLLMTHLLDKDINLTKDSIIDWLDVKFTWGYDY